MKTECYVRACEFGADRYYPATVARETPTTIAVEWAGGFLGKRIKTSFRKEKDHGGEVIDPRAVAPDTDHRRASLNKVGAGNNRHLGTRYYLTFCTADVEKLLKKRRLEVRLSRLAEATLLLDKAMKEMRTAGDIDPKAFDLIETLKSYLK
jgi:hypothetical protein